MFRSIVFCVLATTAYAPSPACGDFEGRPLVENAFTPTGYTFNGGEVSLGVGPLGVGLHDHVHMETNLFLWALQVYNGQLKVALLKRDGGALALGIAARHAAHLNEDDDTTSRWVRPYLSVSCRIGARTLLHGGAHLVFSDSGNASERAQPVERIERGLFGGIQFGPSTRTKLLADIGHDPNLGGVRVGGAALFGWETFRLKLGLSYLVGEEELMVPIIGVRWRFQG
jgi:hypothetical protein